VPVALSPAALVTTEEARSFLGVADDENPTTDQLALIVNGLSSRITQKTGDLYINPVANDGVAERTYEFVGDERKVAIDAARSVTEVALTGSPQDVASWTVLNPLADFYLEPVGAPVSKVVRLMASTEIPTEGVGWGGLSLHANSYNPGPEGDTMWTPWPGADRASIDFRGFLRVKGKFGLAGDASLVPDNVKLAVVMWLQNIDKRDLAFMSETIGTASALTKMPPDVEELLVGESDDQPSVGAV
jgi:hypothetical protein